MLARPLQLSSSGERELQEVLQEMRSAPPVPHSGRAASVAMSLIVFCILSDMLDSTSGLLVVLAVVAIHELGHFLGQAVFGYREREVFFIPLPRAILTESRSAVSVWKQLVVLLLGPTPGLLAALLFAAVHPGDARLTRESIAGQALFASACINGLNLLPFLPLDGGKLARIVFFAERPAVQARVTSSLSLLVAGCAFFAHAWQLGVVASFSLLHGLALGGASRVAERFRARAGDQLAAAPGEAKEASAPLLALLYEEWLLEREKFRHVKNLRPPQVARLLSDAYSNAVTPALSPRLRVVLGLTYLGVTLPTAFVLIDMLVDMASRQAFGF